MSECSRGRWSAFRPKFRGLLFAALASACCGLSCGEKPIDCETVRKAFSHSRSVQPRLSGLGFSPCSSTNDLVPVTKCGPKNNELSPEQKNSLYRGIRRALQATPTTDQLQAAALFKISSEPHDEDALLKASAYLNEAALQESDPHRQAVIRSDLAAVHLLLAEVLQSPLEVAASLEQSLWALELEPGLAEADFNRQLGLLLLGMETPSETSTDPWLAELQLRFRESSSAKAVEKAGCPTRSEIRQELDRWAVDFRQPLQIDDSCLSSSKDHFLADVVQIARSTPEKFSLAWKVLRAANQALRSFDLEASAAELDQFRRLSPSKALSLEADWIAATISYQKNDYDTSLRVLERIASAAVESSYFELTAKSLRLKALIYQVRGDYGTALEEVNEALTVARRSGSSLVEATVLSMMVDIQGLVGREEEAWNYVARALRVLDPKNSQFPRVACLHVAARLAQQRSFCRLARLTYDSTMPLAESLGKAPLASALKERGEYLADIGRTDLARLDLARAKQILNSAEISPDILKVLEEDLLYLEGRVGDNAASRRAAAELALERFRQSKYERNLGSAGLALAEAQIHQGDPNVAIATLQAALSDLARLTTRVSWIEATALVETARPLVDQLIGLQLEKQSEREILRTIGQYLSLRTGQIPSTSIETDDQRLVYFVRGHEIVAILQGPQVVKLVRVKVEREHLESLRVDLLNKIAAGFPEARLSATAQPLADLLIAPFAQTLVVERPLTIVPDDVLTGVPYSLLPFRSQNELLIDYFPIAYSSDLRLKPDSPARRRILVVGSTAKEVNMRSLQSIENEVEGVSQSYAFPHALVGNDATVEKVKRQLFLNPEIGHFASHFTANLRDPLSSYLILEPTPTESGRFEIRNLLSARMGTFDLLYLSACETGRSLPSSASGLHSLAQAFSSARIMRSILSYWPLDDEIGARIAINFHAHFSKGADGAQALRSAQILERSESPKKWAALALYY